METTIQSQTNTDLSYSLPSGYTMYNCIIAGMMVLNNNNWRSVNGNSIYLEYYYPGHYRNKIIGNTKIRIVFIRYN